MNEHAEPMIGTVLHGKYRFVRELGRGAMGVVYEARHLILDNRVAIKMMAPELTNDARLDVPSTAICTSGSRAISSCAP